ncbi:MAG: hypothetical protein MUP47_03025 [Phycisphaerae bacterium]|nr:hypothetical protein [Phycisphaerae bacterium]
MTLRAILLGLLGAIALATLGYINNQVLELPSLIAGHQLPIAVIGTLTVVMVTINPLLWRLRRSWSFRPAELAVAAMLLMTSCSIPGRGFLENFIPSLSLPVHYYSINPGWRKNRVLSYAPRSMMLPAPPAADGSGGTPALAAGPIDPNAVSWLVVGAGQKGRWLALDRVPWKPWVGPLIFWSPMLALMTVAVLCLSLVVHRQWTSHERLRYPIAEFATTLLSRPQGSAVPPVFRNKLFWIGLGVVTAIHVVNGLNKWYSNRLIQVPLDFPFRTLFETKWPILKKFPWTPQLTSLRLFPVVIGFSFFLASEVSLSLGLSQLLFLGPCLVMVTHGVDVSSHYVGGGPGGWQRFGSYLALALMMLYTGRRYYGGVLARALTFRRDPAVESSAAWACRLLLLSLAGMVLLAVSQGLAWSLAILTFLLIFVMLVSATRINAETGLFFVQPRWQPLGVLVGFFGGYALGPQGMVIIALLGMVLCLDVSQALMPYFVNSLRICENVGVRPSRAAGPAGGAYALAMAVGIVVAMWTSYNFGFKLDWSKNRAPKDSFEVVSRELTEVRIAGELEASQQLSPLARLGAFRPQKKFLAAAGIGVALVLVVGLLRLRLPWWPLHPVVFLVWDTHPMSQFSSSFLIGWLVKVAVMRLGGHRIYNTAKPLMTGLIAGDLLGMLIWMVVSSVQYLMTGLVPTESQIYNFLPR